MKPKQLPWGDVPSLGAFRKRAEKWRKPEGGFALPVKFGFYPGDVIVDVLSEKIMSRSDIVAFDKSGHERDGASTVIISDAKSLWNLIRRLTARAFLEKRS